jgi:hypothetical protein
MQLGNLRSYALPHIPERAATTEIKGDRALALGLDTVAVVLIIISLALLFASRQERTKTRVPSI